MSAKQASAPGHNLLNKIMDNRYNGLIVASVVHRWRGKLRRNTSLTPISTNAP